MVVDDLRILLELARSGRIDDVARRLMLDATTVSRRLSRLERALDSRLVDRDRGSWRLTSAGAALLPHAETVEAARLAVLDELATNQRELSGTVRVLTPGSFGTYVLMSGMTPLRARHPGLALEISVSTTHHAANARDFDLAISLEPLRGPAVRVLPLARYTLRLYASQEYLQRAGIPRSTAEVIERHTLIWHIDAILDIPALKHPNDLKAAANAQIQYNDITGHVMAARSGLGIAPLPTYIGNNEPDLVPILSDEFAPQRTYFVIIPENSLSSRRVDAVLSALHGIVAAHPTLVSCAQARPDHAMVGNNIVDR